MSTLGATYTVTIHDVDDYIADGFTHIRFFRSATEAGTYTQVAQIALASGQETYEYNDAPAQPTDWWTWALYGSGTGETARAEPQPVAVRRVTRKELRRAVGFRLGLLEVASVSSGTTTTATCNALVDPDRSPHEVAGGWVLLPSGETRRIRVGTTGYNTSTGTITWQPAATAPSSGQEIEIWSGIIKGDIISAVHRAMNVARHSIWWPEMTTIEVTAMGAEYPLPYNAVNGRVLGVEILQWEDVWAPFKQFETTRRGQQTWIRFQGAMTGQIFRVTYNSLPDAMDGENDSWDVPLEIATAEVAKALLMSMIVPTSHKELIADIAVSVKAIEDEAKMLRASLMPEISIPIVGPR
ncbi:MAG: hypothetical protein KatS3mg015_2866 [Fimbriimonadales bacterium]|nr:MAG: hypothetical protein KatS3mg015_2866 [Fimbriimonadales bacterium]